MALFSPGQILTANSMNSIDTRITTWESFAKPKSDIPVVTGVASGWTISIDTCFRQYGTCHLAVELTPSTALAAGNIANIALFTLPAGYTPRYHHFGIITDIIGHCTIGSTGVVTLTGIAFPWSANQTYVMRAEYMNIGYINS